MSEENDAIPDEENFREQELGSPPDSLPSDIPSEAQARTSSSDDEESSLESLEPPLLENERSFPTIAGKFLVFDLFLCIIWAAASDFLIFQHGTFLAWALQFCFAVTVFGFAKRGWKATWSTIGLTLLLFLLCIKLSWCGSWLQVGCGCMLFSALAMSLARVTPFFPELIAFFGYCIQGIITRLRGVRFSGIDKATGALGPAFVPQVTLPIVVLVIFSTLFVLANPDIAKQFSSWMESSWNSVSAYLENLSPVQVVFWLYSICVLLGFMYPAAMKLIPERTPAQLIAEKKEAPLYSAYRNTLLSVILLFSAYLVFEFATLWFRDFPEDFYYAGYAHQGAFWLTVALALATVVLSLVFQGDTLADPRLAKLKQLAIGWSALNFVLSIAVFNRLMIYVTYNGLTRLRVVGFLGISCVVIGFALVLWKLLKGKGAVWLLHRQSWIPVSAMILYAILPIDWFVQSYNTQQILDERLAPSTQIAAKLTTAEGVLPLFALIDHPQVEVRDGVRAILAIWADQLDVPFEKADQGSDQSEELGGQRGIWTSSLGHSSAWATIKGKQKRKGEAKPTDAFFAWQAAEESLRRRLVATQSKWSPFKRSGAKRLAAINEFYRWAYRWY